MEHERFSITIDGAEATDLYPRLLGLRVELDDGLAGMLRLRLSLEQDGDGNWSLLDDDRLRIWRQIGVEVGFTDGTEPVFTGYLTRLLPQFGPDPTSAHLELQAMDESVLLDREEKLRDWPGKKDSDIAREVLQGYGFDVSGVEDTTLVHDEAISTIIQRESDMRFLKRLALRNGFDCWIENGEAFFRPPRLDEAPQPLLAVHFGEETNVDSLQLEVDALAPAHVAMAQIDPTSKEVLQANKETSLLPALGATTADGFLPAELPAGRVVIAHNATTGLAEMEALCQGLLERGQWFVKARGEVDASRYDHVLKPRQTVTLKGVNATYSGLYYVHRVTHTLRPEGYRQAFEARRNALEPSGGESFAA